MCRCFQKENLFIGDDNGVTGPDWGRSEVVFTELLTDDLHQIIILSETEASATLLFNAFSFVNQFTTKAWFVKGEFHYPAML